jgi:hypothetical protein
MGMSFTVIGWYSTRGPRLREKTINVVFKALNANFTKIPHTVLHRIPIYCYRNVDVFRFFSSPKIGNHTENREIAHNFQN